MLGRGRSRDAGEGVVAMTLVTFKDAAIEAFDSLKPMLAELDEQLDSEGDRTLRHDVFTALPMALRFGGDPDDLDWG